MLDADITPESPFGVLDHLVGTVPIVLLIAHLRPRPERVACIGDLILHPVACDLPDIGLPLFTRPRLIGALPEGVSHPGAGGVKLALGKLVADLGVLARELGDRVLEPIALGKHLGWIAHLAFQAGRAV